MLSHDRIWAAIDALADRHGMTASGLARKAGLDPTSFNRSKRTSPQGRDRWPSTESISKVLRATGSTVEDFLRLLEPDGSIKQTMLPLITLAQGRSGKYFTEEGLPNGGPGWEEIEFPDLSPSEKVFAFEISDQSFEPTYRDGDILILSPTSGLRKGDRIVCRTRRGDIIVGEVKRRLAKVLELQGLARSEEEHVLSSDDIDWVARVVWASQ